MGHLWFLSVNIFICALLVLRPERFLSGATSEPCSVAKSLRNRYISWYRGAHTVKIEWQTKNSKDPAAGLC